LHDIFTKLLALNIKPIIVGGYVRDSLLQINSKDIDIELYGIASFEKLEAILEEFGEVNSVGKSFGVCKLKAFGLDLDFSLPRKDSKVSKGHKGFKIEIDTSLDFKTAASRRDFTINAIGYDVQNSIILDPFDGQKDLKQKLLRVVDKEKFQEDPLRVFRAVQFSARFNLTLGSELLAISKAMIADGLMQELAKERIFEEIKKLLLKSQNISHGIKQLDALGLCKDYKITSKEMYALDKATLFTYQDDKQKLLIMLALWSHVFSIDKSQEFLNALSDDKNLIDSAMSLLKNQNAIALKNFTDFDLYTLACEVKIENFILFLQALYESNTALSAIEAIRNRAIELNIFTHKAPALLGGKDLIALGLKPSKNFSWLLQKAYTAQIRGEFHTKAEAILYFQEKLLP